MSWEDLDTSTFEKPALNAHEEDHLLNDLWSFYFHDPFNSDWNLGSYMKIADIGSIEDFWPVHDTFLEKISMGMFFITREHIFPCWDDPFNKDGGCISIKVLKADIQPFWSNMCFKLLGETLLIEEKRDMWDHVNGLSISPKKHFCIIKVWLRTTELKEVAFFNIPSGFYGEIIYKGNKDSIENQVH